MIFYKKKTTLLYIKQENLLEETQFQTTLHQKFFYL